MLSRKTFDTAVKAFYESAGAPHRDFSVYLSSGHKIEMIDISIQTTTSGFEVHGSDEEGNTIVIDPAHIVGINYFSDK